MNTKTNLMAMPMGLFSHTRNAYEKEAMVQQTYNSTIAKGKEWSLVNLDPDSSLSQNSSGYKYLVENGWYEEKSEKNKTYCKLTDFALKALGEGGYISCK